MIAPIALVTLVALIWLWPADSGSVAEHSGKPESLGAIESIDREPCTEEPVDSVNGCGRATVLITSGPDEDQQVSLSLPNGPGAPEIAEGDAVVLIATTIGADGDPYVIVDHQRSTGLWLLAGAFVLALAAFGRWRGARALVGLGLAFALLLFFVVPAILSGQAPLLVAIVGAAAITLSVLYLTHGFTLSTTIAVLGTLVSLALTGILSAVTVSALHLTGITDDLSLSLGTTFPVNMQGLLLAGIVIGSLGVLDDVTVTQAATIHEISNANPAYDARQLYRAGIRVGRSHISSVVNTIILAYAGSSLPLLILIIANNEPLRRVVTDQIIAQEIVRSVVGTLGLIAAVPVTTWLAALVSARALPIESDQRASD